MANIHLVLFNLYGIILLGGLAFSAAEEENTCDSGIECQNGGICQNFGEDDFLCICPENYYGRHCQTKTRTRGAYWCPILEDNQSGPCYYHCDTDSECAESESCCYTGCGMVCMDYNTRKLNPDKPTAKIADFSLYDACISDEPVCLNGGECYTIWGSARCDCPPHARGERCEINLYDIYRSPLK